MYLSTISNLLESVHKFYPVGMKALEGYPGEKVIKDIVERKVNALINEEQTPWSALLSSTLPLTMNFEVLDFSANQFPSYVGSVIFENINEADFNRRTSLVFSISLLTDHYTYFIHDHYRINSQTEFKGRRKVYQINSAALTSHLSFEKIKSLIGDIEKKISEFFPGYRYINHEQLFNSEVTGAVPYGHLKDYTTPYQFKIYHFLFDGQFSEELNVTP